MKSIDKKDLPKLYVLIGLAVCILGYAIFQFTSGGGNTARAAATKPVAPKAGGAAGAPTAAGAAAPGAAIAPGSLPGFDVALVGPPTGGRDPFMPEGPAQTAQPAPPPHPVAVAARPPLTPLNKLLQLDKPSAPKPAPASSPMPVDVPPPDLTVTGVVLGDLSTGVTRNVAILRGKGGEEDRRFVSVGDPVGNGFRVAAVNADGVDLEDSAGNRRVTLRLGKSGEDVRAN